MDAKSTSTSIQLAPRGSVVPERACRSPCGRWMPPERWTATQIATQISYSTSPSPCPTTWSQSQWSRRVDIDETIGTAAKTTSMTRRDHWVCNDATRPSGLGGGTCGQTRSGQTRSGLNSEVRRQSRHENSREHGGDAGTDVPAARRAVQGREGPAVHAHEPGRPPCELLRARGRRGRVLRGVQGGLRGGRGAAHDGEAPRHRAGGHRPGLPLRGGRARGRRRHRRRAGAAATTTSCAAVRRRARPVDPQHLHVQSGGVRGARGRRQRQ